MSIIDHQSVHGTEWMNFEHVAQKHVPGNGFDSDFSMSN